MPPVTTHAKAKELASQGQIESAAPAGAAPAAQNERVRKITSKLFKEIPIGKENAVKIAGIIRSIKKRVSTLDSSKEYCAFLGDFRLMHDNTFFSSNEMILPGYPETVLEQAFNSAFENAGEGVRPNVTFAIGIYRKDDSANTKNARKFTWEIVELKPIAAISPENDPLLKLLA